MKILFCFATSLFVFSCTSQKLRIETVPNGALVFNQAQEKIGITPIILENDEIEKLSSERDHLVLRIQKGGYEERSLMIEPRFFRDVTLNLVKQDKNAFHDRVLTFYSDEVNSLLTRFLKAQGHLANKQFAKAETEINSIKSDFPVLAPAYVLDADLKLAQGKQREAIESLSTALNLSPNDFQIKRSLHALGVKGVDSLRVPASYKIAPARRTRRNKPTNQRRK